MESQEVPSARERSFYNEENFDERAVALVSTALDSDGGCRSASGQ